MKNTEYHEFFNNCIENNTMTIKKYNSVANNIIKIFTYYNNSGVFDYGWYTDDGINLGELDLIKSVLKTFTKIMKDKKYEQLDEYIDFLLTLDVWYEDFVIYLSMFIYTDYNITTSSNDYYFNKLLRCVGKNIDYVNSINSSTRPINIMKAYTRYYKDPSESGITTHEKDKRNFYTYYASKIINEYYYSQLDVEYLCGILDSISYNYENIKKYLEANNPNHDSFDEYNLILDLIHNYKGTKKLIK